MRHLILLVFVFFATVDLPACGYYLLGEDYRIALLNPYIVGEEYSPFFYSTEKLNHWQNARAGRDRQQNVAAWAKELGAKPADIMKVVYTTDLSDWVGSQRSAYAGNPAYQRIKSDPALLEYMRFIKGYEAREVRDSYWDEEEETDDNSPEAPYRKDFADRAKAGYDAAPTGSFLKERYAYQLLLLASYAEDDAMMATYFNRHFKGHQTALAHWARFHVAGSKLGSGSYAVDMANAFRYAPEKAIAAYLRTDKALDPAKHLTNARTKEAQSNLYALAAVKRKGYALDYLRKAYQLDPTNPVIPMLLSREVNKLEDWLMTYELTNSGPGLPSTDWPDWSDRYDTEVDSLRKENYRRDLKHLQSLRTFLDNDYRPGGDQEAFARVLRGQAALLGEDYDTALRHVASLDGGSEGLGLQVNIIRYLAQLQAGNLTDETVRNQLAEQLFTLEKALKARKEVAYDDQNANPNTLPALSALASDRFLASGDTVNGYLLSLRALALPRGAYASEYYTKIDFLDRPLGYQHYNDIIRVLRRADRSTPFARLQLSGNLPPLGAVYDIAGTVALRANDLAEARAFFAKVPKNFYRNEPFFATHFSGPWGSSSKANSYFTATPLQDVLGGKQAKKAWSDKVALVDELIRLERACGNGADAGAKECLQLGRAWFNMSRMGSSWMVLTYGQSTGVPAGPIPYPGGYGHAAVPTNMVDYNLVYRADRAKGYFSCAENSTEDKEVKAAANFGQQVITYRQAEQQAITESYGYLDKDEKLELRTYYRQLLSPFADTYQDTDYFRQIKSQCSLISLLF